MPIVTLLRLLQYSNVDSPIDVTLSGIVILVSPLQPLNAESPIDVIVVPLIFVGILSSFSSLAVSVSPVIQLPVTL